MMTRLIIKAYFILTYLIYVLILPIALFLKNSKLQERLLLNPQSISKTKSIWIHGASVGEILSAHALITKLKIAYPAYNIIVTSHTATSKNIVKKEFANLAKHFYIPYDCPYLINKFLKQHNIFLALWLEQEFLPATLFTIKNANIPLLLLNARMSNQSFYRWQHVKRLATSLLNNFNLILPMTNVHATYFKNFSNKIKFLGNLKYTNIKLPVKKNLLKELQEFFVNKQVVVALSTHDNEEKNIVNIHNQLIKKYPNLTTLIIPRHPSRCSTLYKQLKKVNHHIAIYQHGIKNTTNLYLVASIGEVKEFCSIADITFVGKSLSSTQYGGHNPLEPVLLKSCTIFGNHMENFADIANDLLTNKASLQVDSYTELQNTLEILLSTPSKINEITHNANTIMASGDIILQQYFKEIQCYL